MYRLRALSAAAAASLALAAGSSASAQEAMTIFGRTLSVTLQARAAPAYIGADRYVFGPTGSFSLDPVGAPVPFRAPDDGLSIALAGDAGLSAGFSGRYRPLRDNDHDLRGFDKVDWAAEAGAYAIWWPVPWLRVRADARRGFRGHRGWVGALGADAVGSTGDWILSLGPRVQWADKAFATTYSGVTPLEAARSPFAIRPYAAGRGLSSAGVFASAEYRWNARWSLVGDAEYHRILGDAADSPIVSTLGSPNQVSASLGLRYSFGR